MFSSSSRYRRSFIGSFNTEDGFHKVSYTDVVEIVNIILLTIDPEHILEAIDIGARKYNLNTRRKRLPVYKGNIIAAKVIKYLPEPYRLIIRTLLTHDNVKLNSPIKS